MNNFEKFIPCNKKQQNEKERNERYEKQIKLSTIPFFNAHIEKKIIVCRIRQSFTAYKS